MLIRVDVAVAAIKKAKRDASKKHKVILLSPSEKRLNQEIVEKFANLDELIIFCAHYEGVDERVREYVDEVISLGDFVLSGAEPAALAIIDAASRLTKGVLGKDESSLEESFSEVCGRDCLEYPQYTRPAEFEGKKVPEVLLSGDHLKISAWRQKGLKKLD
jgi:tRNA (guanine37-N1)-methyltransferase